MIAWRIRRKIIRTVLCCIVYDSCAVICIHIRAVLKVDCLFRFYLDLGLLLRVFASLFL